MKRFTIWLTLLGVLVFLLPACGGGSGNGDGGVPSSSNWDEMQWDQDNWG